MHFVNDLGAWSWQPTPLVDKLTYLLTNRMQEIPKHQTTSISFRIRHCDEGHIVSDASLDPEGVPQGQVRPVRLNSAVILRTVLLPLSATPTAHRLQNIVVHGRRGMYDPTLCCRARTGISASCVLRYG